MRMLRLSTLVPLVTMAALPSLAAANCYSIYDGKNQMLFQSTVAPIDLSGRISETMRARFPGTFLIMIPDESDCREMRTGAVTTRFTPSVPGAVRSPDEVLTASPLAGGIGTGGAVTDGRNGAREAVRSGNNLNLKGQQRP